MKSASTEHSRPGILGYLAVAIIPAVAWLVLLGTDPASWVIGLPCVALCALFTVRAMPEKRVRVSLSGCLRLVPFFLWHSLLGGWDVARRVLSPRLAVTPGFIDFNLQIPPGPGRTFYIQFIGLLPGTLGTWLEGDCLKVHVLTLDVDHEDELRKAETVVQAAFGTGSGH